MPTTLFRLPVCAALAAALSTAALYADYFVTGSDLALRSSGTATGTDLTLSENGYAGTYLVLANPAVVSVAVQASGLAPGAITPQLNVAVADYRVSFAVTPVPQTYTAQFNLPAGRYFLRTELSNALAAPGAKLTVRSISVAGATVDNTKTADALNANALAAADSYISNFRRGSTYVILPGMAPGTPVQVTLVHHAFRFGTEVPGGSTRASVDVVLVDSPAPGSDAANYQERLLRNFNGMTPGNAGKWDANEWSQGQRTLEGVDRILFYAAQHDLRVRQHNLIWGSQQPSWVTALTAEAALPSPAGDGPKAALLAAIYDRIDYFVRARAPFYEQLDVYNESVHTGTSVPVASYWNIYGPAGIADIHNRVDAAAKAAGALNVALCPNEYNVLCDGNDGSANWYRQHVETLLAAGAKLGGIGIQYYSHESIGTGNGPHNASRVFGALTNLAVLGLPLELTEFGIKNDGTGTAAQNQQVAAQILQESMRLMFGHPGASGFTIWGFWAGDVWNQAPDAALYDQTWNLTPAGQAYEQLMGTDWNTNLNVTADANGGISFEGFYGDYQLTAGSSQQAFTLVKGARPDLVINATDISFASLPGGQLTINARVKNIGTMATRAVVVRFADNGQLLGDQVIPALAADGTATVSFPWNAKNGEHLIAVTLDPDGAIAESNENNNQESVNVSVRGRKVQ